MKWLGYLMTVMTAGMLLSCSPVIHTSKTTALSNNYCAPNIPYLDEQVEMGTPDTVVSSSLSEHDYILATHIGLVSLISQFSRVDATPLERLEAKQKMTDKILLFQTEINAVAAELDCNGERFDQLGKFLGDRNDKINNRLTVASIAIGAAITLSTAFIKNNDANTAISIGGGITGAGLGFLLLKPRGKKIALEINRSLLKNVWWENNDNTAFPPALWRVMNEKSFSNDGELSLIQTLRKRWLIFVFNNQVNLSDEQLYFGSGGNFSEEGIQHLSDMNNELQASVRTVQQDLRSLLAAINRL